MKTLLKIVVMGPVVVIMVLVSVLFLALMAIFGDLEGLQARKCESCGERIPDGHRGQICGKEHCQIKARWEEARKGVEKV